MSDDRGRDEHLYERYVRYVVPGTMALGVFFLLVWRVALRAQIYDAIADLPFVTGMAFVIGSVSLFLTTRSESAIRRRITDDRAGTRWLSKICAGTVIAVVIFLPLSLLMVLSAVVYFAVYPRWPFTPSQAGSIGFYAFSGMVLSSLLAIGSALAAAITDRIVE